MNLKLKYISNSQKGINREKNQDSILFIECENYILFMIFDGVSSLQHSYLFIDEFKEQLICVKDKIDKSGNNLDQILYECHEKALKRNILGLTTFTSLFFDKLENKAKYINIGDSRIYVFNNQFIEKITTDDSLQGRENIITKCLGLDSLTIEDFKFNDIECQFNFLICTDGFYKLMHANLNDFFNAFNFKYLKNIEKKLKILQLEKNSDDSSYILIKR